MKSVTMATKREMSDYTVFFSVLGHKKFIHKILAKSESVRFQPLFKIFGALRELLLKRHTKPRKNGETNSMPRCRTEHEVSNAVLGQNNNYSRTSMTPTPLEP